MRSLIVDDELVSRTKLQVLVSEFGPCQAVESGREAVVAFHQGWENYLPLDLIWLDLVMPGMDGEETLIQIRNLENDMGLGPTARVKVVMVTAKSDMQTVRNLMRAGCDDYLVKPFQFEAVRRKIAQLLDWRPFRVD